MSQLDEMRARAEAATPGPWMAFKGTNADGIDCAESGLTWDDHNGEVFKPADADFIAHARTDIPKLLAALEAVQELATGAPRMVTFTGAIVSGFVVADDILTAITEALQ